MAERRPQPWWKQIPLAEMNETQWESLCDHCAKCCLIKLEDEEDSTVYYTDLACELLDGQTCQCTNYAQREVLVPDCLHLTPDNLEQLYWMPPSCAYRLLHEGKNLPSWHHLVSGDKDSIHRMKQSVHWRFTYVNKVGEEDWEERVVTWPLKLKM